MKQIVDDTEQLQAYVRRGDEDAFRTLVERHTGMVRGVAFRIVQNDSWADEVTQAVFVILARKAGRLSRRVVVAGWLHQTARYVAWEALRRERRRLEHEERMIQSENSQEGASVWQKIAPQLDEALGRLGGRDREALVLRFLEQRSFAEVAGALHITEAAAKMRVGRALEKLRSTLARTGIVVPAAALVGALSTFGASAAPSTLTASVSAAALAQSGAVSPSIVSLVKGTLYLMAWKKIKVGAVAVVLLLLLGGGGMVWWNRAAPPRFQPPVATVLVKTFEPMAGEWVGTFSLERDGSLIAENRPCGMTVTTKDGGLACEIELRTRFSQGADPLIQHYTHRIEGRGDRLFTTSDPASGRGDGEGQVTESVHHPATGEWRVAMRFPLPGSRGVMEGSWERRGDTLVVLSHDEFYHPSGSSHVHARLELRRRTGPQAAR